MKFIFFLLSLLWPTYTLAMFCPTNFKSIDLGDTIEFVIESCGNPVSRTTYNPNPQSSAQKWEYVKTNAFDPTPTKMEVLFKDDKVINISLVENNAISAGVCEISKLTAQGSNFVQTVCNKPLQVGERNVSTTPVCGQLIRIGDNKERVKTACGEPVLINEYHTPSTITPQRELIALQYDGPNAASLIFENGRLIDRINT